MSKIDPILWQLMLIQKSHTTNHANINAEHGISLAWMTPRILITQCPHCLTGNVNMIFEWVHTLMGSLQWPIWDNYPVLDCMWPLHEVCFHKIWINIDSHKMVAILPNQFCLEANLVSNFGKQNSSKCLYILHGHVIIKFNSIDGVTVDTNERRCAHRS